MQIAGNNETGQSEKEKKSPYLIWCRSEFECRKIESLQQLYV